MVQDRGPGDGHSRPQSLGPAWKHVCANTTVVTREHVFLSLKHVFPWKTLWKRGQWKSNQLSAIWGVFFFEPEQEDKATTWGNSVSFLFWFLISRGPEPRISKIQIIPNFHNLAGNKEEKKNVINSGAKTTGTILVEEYFTNVLPKMSRMTTPRKRSPKLSRVGLR